MTADYWRHWPVPVTFTSHGDKVKGEIVALGDLKEKWPELHIRTPDGLVKVIRITQARLHKRLAELLPCVGDRIWIVYTGDARKAAPGMSPAKEFTVEVRRQGSQPEAGAEAVRGDSGSENEPRAGSKGT